jgi:hypothetical protein
MFEILRSYNRETKTVVFEFYGAEKKIFKLLS